MGHLLTQFNQLGFDLQKDGYTVYVHTHKTHNHYSLSTQATGKPMPIPAVAHALLIQICT